MLVNIIVGQIWTDGNQRYEITYINIAMQPYARCLETDSTNRFADPLIDGCYNMPPDWYLYRVDKVIPDFPLDATLPILQAGYIQDRQRKQFTRIKGKENVK